MSENLTFTDGTVLSVIGWYNNGKTLFQGYQRKYRQAKIAESNVSSIDSLKAMLLDHTKTVKIIHNLADSVSTVAADSSATTGGDGTTSATSDDGFGDTLTTTTTVVTDTTAKTRTTTVKKSVELDNFVFLHHIRYEYDEEKSCYYYDMGLCCKTDAELQNEALKAQLASSLEG